MKKERKKITKNIDSTAITLLYYLSQFCFVWVCLFGFTIQPSITAIYNGLNITPLLTSVFGLVNFVKVAWAIKYILLIPFGLVPFVLHIAWELRNIALLMFVGYQTFIAVKCYAQYVAYKLKLKTKDVVTIKVGQPGTGKSSSGLWQAVAVSKKMWREVQYKYWLIRQKIDRLNKLGKSIPVGLQTDFDEVLKTYRYYKDNNCVPCLWTNTPVKVDGKYTSILTRKHALQIRRLPAYSVLFFDEVGAVFPVDDGHAKPLAVSDFYRLCRHFGEFRIIATEQDRENIYIDIRRVVADNEQMIGQRWLLKPLIPLALFHILKFVFMFEPHRFHFLASVLRLLSKCIKYIGFRQFRAVSTGSCETAYSAPMKRRVYCLPTLLNCTYDDRTYRQQYKAIHKKIHPDIFDSLILPKHISLLRDNSNTNQKTE